MSASPTRARRSPEAHVVDALFDLAHAASVEVPTLVLVASDSPEIFQTCAQNLVETMPDARAAVLDGQGHAAEMFTPKAIAEQVMAFLDGQA